MDMLNILIDTITKAKDSKADTNAGRQGFFIFILFRANVNLKKIRHKFVPYEIFLWIC